VKKTGKVKPGQSRAPIPVRAVDFIVYCTKNPKRTRTFYQKLFGFQRGEEWNDSWSEFNTSPIRICLNGLGHKPKWDWQWPAAVALAVDDIQAAARRCRRRRVKILVPPVETRVCWFAIIADPDGNRICLHRRKDGTAV